MINLAEEQGFTLRAREDGIQFTSEKGSTFVHDPGTDNGARKVVKLRMERIGLNFRPERNRKQQQPANVEVDTTMASESQTAAPEKEKTLFELAREKMSNAINALSDLEKVLNQIESEGGKLKQLRDLLKNF